MQHESSYIDKAVEGMLMTFFNQGEVCTCPSRALVQASIYDDFMDKVLARARTIVQGNPSTPPPRSVPRRRASNSTRS